MRRQAEGQAPDPLQQLSGGWGGGAAGGHEADQCGGEEEHGYGAEDVEGGFESHGAADECAREAGVDGDGGGHGEI